MAYLGPSIRDVALLILSPRLRYAEFPTPNSPISLRRISYGRNDAATEDDADPKEDRGRRETRWRQYVYRGRSAGPRMDTSSAKFPRAGRWHMLIPSRGAIYCEAIQARSCPVVA